MYVIMLEAEISGSQYLEAGDTSSAQQMIRDFENYLMIIIKLKNTIRIKIIKIIACERNFLNAIF